MSTSIPSIGNSPVKPQKSVQQDTRVKRSHATKDRQTHSKSAKFQSLCLTEVPANVVAGISEQIKEDIKKVETMDSQNDGYRYSVILLNKLVQSLKTYFPNEYTDDKIIVFLAKPNDPPKHHPRGYHVRPDILALLKRLADRLQGTPSWHHLRSVGEWKPGLGISNADRGQEREYVACTMQARPDNPSVLGIVMCPGGYVLSYGSPCGYIVTEQFPYLETTPLIRYVHSLHAPLRAINFSDPIRTMTLDESVDLGSAPRWLVTDPAYSIDNRSFSLLFVGAPFTRMTTVFAADDYTILKDSYPSNNQEREAGLFDKLGENPPGWVIQQKPDNQDVKFANLPRLDFDVPSFTHRVRHRISLKSTGDPFEKCESLSVAVGATYDILESKEIIVVSLPEALTFYTGSRWAIVHCRVLHRDISPGNVLLHPRPASLPRDGACFIRGVYNRDPTSPSLSILLDLDNGVQLPAEHKSVKEISASTSNESRELKALTGTPMYIARGPSAGEYDPPDSPYIFQELPKIEPSEAAELYAAAYPNDAFRKLQGKIGEYDTVFEKECVDKEKHTLHLIQRPWHDAESTLLIFLIFLLRCKPRTSAPETSEKLDSMQDLYYNLRRNAIGAIDDSRDTLIQASRRKWGKYLHDELLHVIDSVSTMCRALQYDYEFLVPAAGVDHELVLHEILQRLLFQIYYKFRKGELADVALDTSSFRPFYKI
ncbi:hypothetical protein VKT23_004672 [Stygiomarasmius scandens]|uniref:Non-specific serine/threonine protein kinase n=1 Tax=Marasmiellus scandens TaxID=2682957 RepID=A0ABR1JVN5_9AGAR